MIVRRYEAKDYATLYKWWKKHEGWEPVGEILLPDTGLVVEVDEKLVAAGFVYLTNSAIAWMEWVVCDPEADRKVRGPAIDLLLEKLFELAKHEGAQLVFSSIKPGRFEERLLKHNFVKADEGMVNLWKGVK